MRLMTRGRTITISIESPLCVYIRGYGSRELLTQLRGRSPIWSSTKRAWVTREQTARDLAALAEIRGHTVIFE